MTLSRSRVAAGLTMAAVAIPSVAVAPSALAATKVPKAGQACKKKAKAPTGFKCVKNKKGKYVLKKG